VPPAALVGRVKLRYPLAVPASSDWTGGLIPLPHDYAELMNLAGEFTSGNSVTGEPSLPHPLPKCQMYIFSNKKYYHFYDSHWFFRRHPNLVIR